MALSIPIQIDTALLAFNLTLYWETLSYGYVIDDIEWRRTVTTPTHVPHDIQEFLTLFTRCFYGCSPLPKKLDHAITLTLHIVTACLIFKVATAAAAFLWSCHPCNHQTSIWLNGRRYSILNIIVLTIWLTHTYWLIILVAVPLCIFAYTQLNTRRVKNIPTHPYNLKTVFKTILLSIQRLIGIGYTPMFFYPYTHVAPFLPYTQPVAERYLSIPLLILCCLAPWWCIVLLPLYCLQTAYLMPMYQSVQAFYDYHVLHGATAEKLTLLRKLYNGIFVS